MAHIMGIISWCCDSKWISSRQHIHKNIHFLGIDLYGPEFVVFNVHNLFHLTEDALRFDGLDNASGFPFENYLGKGETISLNM